MVKVDLYGAYLTLLDIFKERYFGDVINDEFDPEDSVCWCEDSINDFCDWWFDAMDEASSWLMKPDGEYDEFWDEFEDSLLDIQGKNFPTSEEANEWVLEQLTEKGEVLKGRETLVNEIPWFLK